MAAKKKQTTPDAPTEEIEPVQEDGLTPDTLDHSLIEDELPALDPDLPDTPENQAAVESRLPPETPTILDSGDKIIIVTPETTPETLEANLVQSVEMARVASYWAREGRPTRFSYAGKDYVVEMYLEGPKFNEVGRTKPSAILAEKTSFGRRGGN